MLPQSIALLLLIAATDPKFGRPVEVKPSEIVTIQGLRITFERVGEDSRSPTGVRCKRADDAATTSMLQLPPAAPQHRTLHINGLSERQVAIDAFMVCLDDVNPYSKVGAAIAAEEYLAPIVGTQSRAEELAGALVATANDADRTALLRNEPESVTPALVQALITRGNQLFVQGDYCRPRSRTAGATDRDRHQRRNRPGQSATQHRQHPLHGSQLRAGPGLLPAESQQK